MLKDYSKLTGRDVMNYQRYRRLTKGDIKFAFFNGCLLTALVIAVII